MIIMRRLKIRYPITDHSSMIGAKSGAIRGVIKSSYIGLGALASTRAVLFFLTFFVSRIEVYCSC